MTRQELVAHAFASRLPAVAEREQIRRAAGLSLEQVGAACGGASAMAVWRWEKGATPRDPAQRREYALLLNELRSLAE